MNTASQSITVFCVDDNPHVIEAVQLQLRSASDIKWKGHANEANGLVEKIQGDCPDVILMDIDMPGKDPFEVISELRSVCGDARVVMFSALVQRDLLERAIDAGAWGYVAKADGAESLVKAIRTVVSGSMGFSPSIANLHR